MGGYVACGTVGVEEKEMKHRLLILFMHEQVEAVLEIDLPTILSVPYEVCIGEDEYLFDSAKLELDNPNDPIVHLSSVSEDVDVYEKDSIANLAAFGWSINRFADNVGVET